MEGKNEKFSVEPPDWYPVKGQQIILPMISNPVTALRVYNDHWDEENPNHFLYARRARAKVDLQDFTGAMEDLIAANEISPNNPFVLKEYGWYYLVTEDYLKAVDFYTITIDLFEAHDHFEHAIIVRENRAIAYVNLEQYQIAWNEIKLILERGGECYLSYYALANLCTIWKNSIVQAICWYRIADMLSPGRALYEWAIAQLYSDWDDYNVHLDQEFEEMLSKSSYNDHALSFFIDQTAFNERKLIALGYFAKAFLHDFERMRTDIYQSDWEYKRLTHFIGESEFMLSSFEHQALYFGDVRNFNDLTDCPLLHTINHSKAGEAVVYDNVRIRCLGDIQNVAKEYKMWADYASGNKGIAVTYKIKKEWFIENEIYVGDVRYIDDSINYEISMTSPEQVIIDGLFVKHSDHSFEKEVRLLKFGNFAPKKTNGVFIPWKSEESDQAGLEVEAIYLGMKLTETRKTQIMKYAANLGCKLFQMTLGKNMTLISNKIFIE